MTTRPKQMQKWSNRHEKTRPTDKNRHLQFLAETQQQKIRSSDEQNKINQSNKTHNKLMKDLKLCPNSLHKCKRGAKTVQNASKHKKATPIILGENISNKLSTAISQTKHTKSSKTRKNPPQRQLITHRTKKSKNSATKTAKHHHKRQTSTYKSPWP